MDAGELNSSVDVAVPSPPPPKLVMGSESFNIVKGASFAKEHDSGIVTASSVERCTPKDINSNGNALESASSNKILLSGSNGSNFHCREVPERNSLSISTHLSSSLDPENVQRKGGRISATSNSCPKRPRMTHDTLNLAVVADEQISSDQVGSYSNRSTSLDKRLVKQKSSISCKRGDRRNSKLPLKAKYDAFPLKPGSASFSSSGGGNGFSGAYGLKTDSKDLTEIADDLSLHDLLDGYYEVPRLGKDKPRRESITNETIMVTFRKACSVLQLQWPIQALSSPDTDNVSGKEASSLPIPAPADATVITCDRRDSTAANISSSQVLEQLALPPPKDLESLLLDASKSVSRTPSDLRSGKQTYRRTSLPTFHWSHSFSGHGKTLSDAPKSPLSRATCQGRWAKIVNTAISRRGATGFTNLESLTYDQSLVLLGESSPGTYGSITLSWCNGGSSSVTGSFISSQDNLESGGVKKPQQYVEHCPLLLAAAKALHGISILNVGNNLDEGEQWRKKSSQKALKVRKSRSNGKHDSIFREGFLNQLKNADKMASRKPMISTVETNHNNCIRKGPIGLSTSILTRSSPVNHQEIQL